MKIISGGQTGADQGGLFGARDVGAATGGWAPKGWRTDDGPAPWLADYGLVEHEKATYPPRTEANVRDSDLTVWFGRITSPGYACTKRACQELKKSLIENPSPVELAELMDQLRFRSLNVAGNRERTNPGINERTRLVVGESLRIAKRRGIWRWEE